MSETPNTGAGAGAEAAMPFWKTPLGMGAIGGGAIAAIAIVALVFSVLTGGPSADDADEELDRFLGRSDLDDVFDYDQVTTSPFSGLTIHDVSIEIRDEDVGTIDQIVVNNWRVRDEILERASVEIRGIRRESTGYDLVGGPQMLTTMLMGTRLISNGVAGAVRTPPEATVLSIDWSYDPGDETAVLSYEQATEGLGVSTFEFEFEQVPPRAIEELFEAIEDLGPQGGAGLALGQLGVVFAAQDFLEELEDVEIASARHVLRDDGLIAAIEQVMAYDRGLIDDEFSLSDHVFDPAAADDSRTDEILENLEDLLGRDNFEAVREALRPGGQLIIETDFRRPMPLFDDRGGRIMQDEDTFDFAELLEDRELVFRAR